MRHNSAKPSYPKGKYPRIERKIRTRANHQSGGITVKYVRLFLVTTTLLVTATLLLSCGLRKAPLKVEKAALGTTRNVHICRDFYLAGQPSEADLLEAKNVGIKTVVNLRMPKELTFHEQEVVNKLGMTYHNPGIGAPEMMTDELFDKIRGILNDSENQPILMHCGSANRVGAIWLAYRVLDGGLSYEDALTEAKTVGLRSPAMEEKAKDYIERNK